MSALVSCIIPVFNGERFIGEAIASIRAQTHQPIEIIVVDDGSTDNTEAAARAASPDIVYRRQANAGPAKARNLALSLATGEFIAFLDADDRFLPAKIEKQLAFLIAHPTIDLVLTHVRLFWEGLENEAAAYRHDNREETAGLANSTMLVRRSVFDRAGVFDEQLPHAATVEWFRTFSEKGIASDTLQEALVERRMHADNYSRKQRAVSHDEFLHLVKRAMDAKRNKPPAV
ncbi:MAG: glycosyltransferase family 2 protein [Gemmatimonas sp.]